MTAKERSVWVVAFLCLFVVTTVSADNEAAKNELDDGLETPKVTDQGESSNLEKMVVTATRTEKLMIDVPAAVTVQDMDELRQRGFTYGTDEFRGVPGVFFRRGEGDGEEFPFISFRGITGNHGNDTFLALVDGIPFVGADEEVLLFEVPYPAIDQIDVVRGPVSALYGRGAIGGAVNYQTRNINRSNNEFSLTTGSDEYYRAGVMFERQVNDRFGLLASVNHENYEGWRENSARETTSIFLKATSELSDSSQLTGYFSYYDREAEVPSVIPTLADGTLVEVFGGDEGFLGQKPTFNDVNGYLGVLRYERQLSQQLNLQVTAQVRQFDNDVRLNFYDFFEFDPDNNIMGVNGFASENETDVWFLESVLSWQHGRHDVVAGLSVERTTLDEADRWTGEIDPFFSGECGFRFYAILIDYSTGAILNDDPGNSCFVREQLRTVADTTNQFYGAFIQDEISLSERLKLTLGLRYDAFERDIDFSVIGTNPVDQSASGDADAFSPKATLAYEFDQALLYASYGRGFNSNFGPVFQWEPDRFARDEQPTTIDSFEIGWKGRTANGKMSWETALFYLEQSDRRIFIDNPDANGPPTLATTGQEYSSRGLEASINWWLSADTSMLVNYTYLDPEWEELIIPGSFGGPDSDFSGNTPQGVPGNIFYVDLSHKFSPQFKVHASYEWYGDYFVDLSNQVEAGQHDLLNLAATYSFKQLKDSHIDVSLTNLLDEDYYYFFAGSRTAVTNVSPGVPRQFRVSFRKRF